MGSTMLVSGDNPEIIDFRYATPRALKSFSLGCKPRVPVGTNGNTGGVEYSDLIPSAYPQNQFRSFLITLSIPFANHLSNDVPPA